MFFFCFVFNIISNQVSNILTFIHCSTTQSSNSSSLNSHPESAWLQQYESPLIQPMDQGDGKSLKLRFDVSQYAPEEIVVKTIDNKLLVS